MVTKYIADKDGSNWIKPILMFTEDQWTVIEACMEVIRENSKTDLTDSKCFEFMAAEFLSSCEFPLELQNNKNFENKSVSFFEKKQESRDLLSKNMYVFKINKSKFCVANIYKHTSYVVVVTGDKYYCECPDFHHREFLCKHVEAVGDFLKNH